MEAALQNTLQGILVQKSSQWNVSFSYALYNDSISVRAAGGRDDYSAAGSLLSTETRIPMGSSTKTFTAAAVLRAAEAGAFGLEDRLAPLVDPLLARSHNTSLAELWGGPALENVTVRQVLNMRAGLHDYDDSTLFYWTLNHPSDDALPVDMLRNVSKKAVCAVDTCGSYSSIG
jgi:CubicO group peptidase (beta-lactamase class C family)